MTDLPNIEQGYLGRAASVKTKGDHIAVRFFYMTPFAATLSNLLFTIIPLVAGYCFVSDGIFAYFWGISPYPHAQKYIPFFYNIYAAVGDLALSIFYVLVYDSQAPDRTQNGLFLIGSGLVSFLLFSSVSKFIQAHDLAPMLFKPILQRPMTIRFYPDKIKVGLKTYDLGNTESFFNDDPLRHRRLLRTSSALHRSRTILIEYGATPVKLVTIFGVEKAERVTVILGRVLARFRNE